MGKFLVESQAVRWETFALDFLKCVLIDHLLTEHIQNGASLTSFEVRALLL